MVENQSNRPFIYVLLVFVAFIIVLVSVLSVSITQMGLGDFYVETILPLPYWIGLSVIAIAAFLMLRFVDDKQSTILFIIVAIILVISFRVAFPLMFTSVPAYEPDATHYMTVINSWVNSGINFGHSGDYEHDYPLSFLIGYIFVKLGFSVDAFFRVAPFVIYVLDLLLIFFLVKEISPENKKLSMVSVFLFSLSSLGYWVAVHFCPDIVGSFFFLLSLYLSVKFAKTGVWSIRTLAPVLISIAFLVLAHHLSTLYFVLTMLGLAFSTWFFKPKQIKGDALSFFILGIWTYTFWFAYGELVYPSFFNVYSYFSGYGSTTNLVQAAGWFNNFTFAIYPAFIIGLFLIELFTLIKIKSPKDFSNIRAKIRDVRVRESSNLALCFSVGFSLIVVLLLFGFVAPVSFPTRVLEVLCVGLYPLSSVTFLKFSEGQISKKKLAILIIILLIVLLTGIHRYYSQIQRRVNVG